MQDLQEVTQDLHYENFRSDRLKRSGRLSSHGYILPRSPAYVLVCRLSALHLPPLKQQTFDWTRIVLPNNSEMSSPGSMDGTYVTVVKQSQNIQSCVDGSWVTRFDYVYGHALPVFLLRPTHTV